ncbi:MAG: hypothetical protein RLZZ623_3892 [Actinomycetota bacterium]
MSVPISGAARAPVKVFVAATGNGFMRDIASWLVEAATLTGRTATLVDDHLPRVDGSINLVVAPHEFFELFDASTADLQRAAAASICVCTEQPDTPWFHLSVDACRRGLHTLDINPHGVAALRDVGVDAAHLALGAVPSMTAPTTERNIDLLFMGGLDDQRAAVLADLAPHLFRRATELRLFRFDRPITVHTPGVVFGTDKYELLARSATLLNLHRDRSAHLPAGSAPPSYFEWARMIEAMANGCVVITEPSEGFEPLVAGTHFVEASPDQLASTIDELLADSDRLEQIRTNARRAVCVEFPLERSLGPALDHIEHHVLPRMAGHVATSRPTRGLWRLGGSKVSPPVRLAPFRPYLSIQKQAKRLALAENAALRQLDSLTCLLNHGTAQHIERVETPAFATARPQVSVLVTLYNYADVVTETLDSILASEGIEFELIVVDDHATDHSRAVVRAYIDMHPEAPIVLLGKDANEGLAAARNIGFGEARAPFVMVIDADNMVYPTALAKLLAALQTEPGAAAAFSILEDFGDRRALTSALAWDVDRLCGGNYIDAQAMWRHDAWKALGGYRNDDDQVYGWEDWDLWLRLAAKGGHAVLVPQVLGRYRVQSGSMIALTNLATDDAIDSIRARYPALPWQPLPPR